MSNYNTIGRTTVYLDQNKWIDLAKAFYNHPDGGIYKNVLDKIKKSILDKKTIFPLSAYHVLETNNIDNLERREKISEIMTLFSVGYTMAYQGKVFPIEIQISFAKIFGIEPPSPPNVFGRGIPFAFDIDPNKALERRNLNSGITENQIKELTWLTGTPMATKKFLMTTNEIARKKMKEDNFLSNIETTEGVEKFREQFKSINRSEAFHKHIYTKNLITVLRETINEAVSIFGKSVDDLIKLGDEKVNEFIHGTPTLDIELELVVKRNVSWDKKIDKNDHVDIGFLLLAVPYCDIVITENFWCHILNKSGLGDKYNTVILDDIRELEKYL